MHTLIDIDALLQPLSPESPCGDNLEYAPEFTAMLAAASGKAEQQVGTTVVAGVAPAWAEVAERCEALLAHTRDLRVAVRLAQALLHLQGFAGFRVGLALVRGFLDRYGPELHPRLDPDDGFDPAIRVTAVALLANLAAIVHPLRDATALLPEAGEPAITLRHVQRARGGEAATPSAGEIEEALDSVDLAALRALAEAAHGARADALAIEAVLRERSGVALTLDFDPLHKALAEIDTLASDWLARRPVPEDGVDADGSEAGAEADPAIVETSSTSADTPRARMPADPIANREDALRVLDDVSRWFRRHEPSHPVPILLERARRWIEMDFMDLLRDVAPEAVVQAEKLHGAIRAE